MEGMLRVAGVALQLVQSAGVTLQRLLELCSGKEGKEGRGKER